MTLPRYAQWLITEQDVSSYYNSLLLSGQAARVAELIQQTPSSFAAVIDVLSQNIGLLTPLTQAKDARLRADACYYLELSGNSAALSSLQACLNDPDPSVRDVAADGIAHLATLAKSL